MAQSTTPGQGPVGPEDFHQVAALKKCSASKFAAAPHHADRHGLPGLWAMLEELPGRDRPKLMGGDIRYGNEPTMMEAVQRYGVSFQSCGPKVRAQIDPLERWVKAWQRVGDDLDGEEV